MTGGQIGNVDLVKQLNSAAVYRLIDLQGPISRIQVADVSQLAPASVTKITRQLLERGLIKEVAQQASTGGRRAISLTTLLSDCALALATDARTAKATTAAEINLVMKAFSETPEPTY